MDLGSGTGNKLDWFDASRIEHVYGIEPNVAFRGAFLERLNETKLGVDGKFSLINALLEEGDVLSRFTITERSVDCVVSMQVLVCTTVHTPPLDEELALTNNLCFVAVQCSIPDVEISVRQIHGLLKPGGEFIFWEHCCNNRTETRVVQCKSPLPLLPQDSIMAC